MLKQSLRCKIITGVLLGAPLFCSGAFAQGNDYGKSRDDHADHQKSRGEERHYYRDGRWYKHDEHGKEVSVADLFVGAIAEALPPQHKTVVVENTSYYYDNAHYYRQRPEGGYVVVAEPRRR